jgi:hypothetical protein
MAFTPATMAILEKVYLFFSIFLLGIAIYLIYKQGKQIEAVLLTIIGAAAIFYYWIKWFRIKQADAIWPPYISPCPDYLSLVSPAVTGDDRPVCMDFIGVTTMPLVFKKTSREAVPKITDKIYDDQVFKVPARGDMKPDEHNKAICDKVKSYGLTWEGVCE